ncbi:MAG: DUF302 domain-containing protein [Candidatus Kapabacteria bacterium]|nr:DUF302 domain-containing protein [Candidatus Kapabacteria bacterium]
MEKYYFSKILNCSFDEAIEKVKHELSQFGFGVLMEIDVQDTLKKKLDVDFRKYRILGACHPPSAYKAFLAEDKIGTMLPCNIVVQELESDKIEVAAIDPIASMMAVENEKLGEVAKSVANDLKEIIGRL